MSCKLAKHCLFLLFRVYLKKTGLFQEHERRYFNRHNSEVFTSRDNFVFYSQSFPWTACKMFWPISHKLALSLISLPVNKIMFAVFLYISTYLSFQPFRKTNKNLIFSFSSISSSSLLSVFSMFCLVFDGDNVVLDHVLYLKPLPSLSCASHSTSIFTSIFLSSDTLTPFFHH